MGRCLVTGTVAGRGRPYRAAKAATVTVTLSLWWRASRCARNVSPGRTEQCRLADGGRRVTSESQASERVTVAYPGSRSRARGEDGPGRLVLVDSWLA